jgi:hypothetical protein
MRPMTAQRPGLSDELLSTVVSHLAAELGRSPTSIDVVRVEQVTWRDGSLGCPKPGMSYTQALIEGFWVILTAEGRTYDYRVGRSGIFLRCDHADEEAVTGSPGWNAATE